VAVGPLLLYTAVQCSLRYTTLEEQRGPQKITEVSADSIMPEDTWGSTTFDNRIKPPLQLRRFQSYSVFPGGFPQGCNIRYTSARSWVEDEGVAHLNNLESLTS